MSAFLICPSNDSNRILNALGLTDLQNIRSVRITFEVGEFVLIEVKRILRNPNIEYYESILQRYRLVEIEEHMP